MARDNIDVYSACINATEYFMRFLTAERISNILHIALVAMIGFASLRVLAHIAERLV
jgi:hypothetical protein